MFPGADPRNVDASSSNALQHAVLRSLVIAAVLVAVQHAAPGYVSAGEARQVRNAPLGTLAYVVTQCRVDPRQRYTGRQRLIVQRGNRAPVTVMDLVTDPATDDLDVCALFGEQRFGSLSTVIGYFHRLAVRPDGEAVVFEVTNRHSFLPDLAHAPAAPEEGVYLVGADGKGLRRLGPASKRPDFVVFPDPTPSPNSRAPQLALNLIADIVFGPDGRTIAFTDDGPGPDGRMTAQVFTLDVVSGRRRQVTSLPSGARPPPAQVATRVGRFIDEHTLAFATYALGGETESVYAIGADGTGLRSLDVPIPLPGASPVPSFAVTGERQRLLTFELPATAENVDESTTKVHEAFLLDGRRLLQLSSFRRVDTQAWAFAGGRAFLTGSANPFGRNPDNGCQLFSVDRRGQRLRQLTTFRGSPGNHCTFGTPECYVAPVFRDQRRRSLVFMSSCGPVDGNPAGAQLFSMGEDGTALRQLTNVGGTLIEPDGGLRVELPGPFAYSSGGAR
jgi:hypothetical protein